jgi:serine/threonine protein phosphatase 1
MDHRLFAIGDIHGCFDPLRKLIEEKIILTPNDKLFLLGDYIDRGPKSNEVIDYILELKNKGFDITPLRGNHEQMLLDAWEEEDFTGIWMINGGKETLKSFGIKNVKDLEPLYLDFFRSLKLFAEIENYLFVHAGFNDELDYPFEDTFHMIWKCRNKYSHPLLKDKTIVHGHCTITASACDERIKANDPVINLDSGCVYTGYKDYGRLTALELNSLKIQFVHATNP